MAPPIPGRLELPSPDANLRGRGTLFRRYVIERVFAIGQGETVAHHPVAEVLARNRADRDHASVAICVLLLTAYGTAANEIGQSKRRLLAAAVFLTVEGA